MSSVFGAIRHSRYVYNIEIFTYGDPALLEVQPHGERLPHEDVRVVAREECPLELLQLPAVEVGPAPPSLRSRALGVRALATAASATYKNVIGFSLKGFDVELCECKAVVSRCFVEV